LNYDSPLINNPESIPDVLYKYRDWEDSNHKKILTDCEIYFPSFDQFNDPFDGTIPVRYRPEDLKPENIFTKLFSLAKHEHPDLTEQQLHELCFKNQREGYITDESRMVTINEFFHRKMNKEFGIFSLADNCSNHLMWSHYSNSHKGICIGFNVNELKSLIGGGCGIFSMYYKNELPYFDLYEDDMKYLKKLLCSKSSVWTYEQEYRIIRFGFARKILKITPKAISEVIFGLMMDHKTKMEILELIKNNFPDTKVFEAKRNTNLFAIDIEQIY